MKQALYNLTGREIDALKIPEKYTVSELAAKYRILTSETSNEPGKWKNERTPHAVGIMDAFSDLRVVKITIMTSTQIGKSESLINMFCYAVDQDPGPIMVVFATEDMASEFSIERFQPALKSSPEYRKYIPGNVDKFTKHFYGLYGMNVYFAWAGSPATLAGRPIRYYFGDEIDKWPKFAGREANPLKLGEERTRTFPTNKKIVYTSTPTVEDGNINTSYQQSDRCKYWVPCVHCGVFQTFEMANLTWPRDANHESVRKNNSAVYHCPHCKGIITDADKVRMCARGSWVPEGGTIDKNGVIHNAVWSSHRGFHINCFYSPWLTFSDIASEWLESKDAPDKLQNFINSWLGEPWVEKTAEIKAAHLKKKQTGYSEGIVPNEVKVLTAAVDVQADGMYFVVRGWGFYETSWRIREGVAENWYLLQQELFGSYYEREHGSEQIGVRLAAIDSGYLTDQVYEFCRQNFGRAIPVKGQTSLQGEFYRLKKIDRNPRTGQAYKEGIVLYHLDTTVFKDKLSRLINSDNADLTGWWLPVEVSERYLKMMCSERKEFKRDAKTGRGKWIWVDKTLGQNHFWDCEVYNVACAQILGVPYMRPEGDETIKTLGMEFPKPADPVGRMPREKKRGGWLAGRGRSWRGRK